jgi:xanthine dehydrogenase accessory factor
MESLSYNEIRKTRIVIRGAGEQASGIAQRLFRSGFSVCLVETAAPIAVRRMVSFCEAVYDGKKTVEGTTAVRIADPEQIFSAWSSNKIPLLIDPDNNTRHFLKPHVVVDAILAKRNIGTKITDSPLVIGLGPGFCANKDVHIVIETNRGHNLGRLIFEGEAEPNTGIPGSIGGYSIERVFRAQNDGIFRHLKNFGDMVAEGDTVAHVEGTPIKAGVSGVIRGILRDGLQVKKGMKAGDIDPRGEITNCITISDKARAIGGSVLEAILYQLPQQKSRRHSH